jgi:hypothetical protein
MKQTKQDVDDYRGVQDVLESSKYVADELETAEHNWNPTLCRVLDALLSAFCQELGKGYSR